MSTCYTTSWYRKRHCCPPAVLCRLREGYRRGIRVLKCACEDERGAGRHRAHPPSTYQALAQWGMRPPPWQPTSCSNSSDAVCCSCTTVHLALLCVAGLLVSLQGDSHLGYDIDSYEQGMMSTLQLLTFGKQLQLLLD